MVMTTPKLAIDWWPIIVDHQINGDHVKAFLIFKQALQQAHNEALDDVANR